MRFNIFHPFVISYQCRVRHEKANFSSLLILDRGRLTEESKSPDPFMPFLSLGSAFIPGCCYLVILYALSDTVALVFSAYLGSMGP